jgi:predicted enzyme related to lactoylglutathione lyase
MSRPRIAWGEVTLDCLDATRVAEFWSELLGVRATPQDNGLFQLGPMVQGGPVLNVQPVPEKKTAKARMHLDVWTDDLDAAVALVQELGGSDTGEHHTSAEGRWFVMADPEGNEFCLVALKPG